MNLADIITLGFDLLKNIKLDFSTVGLDVTISCYELFWGMLLLSVLMGIFWDSIMGGKK